MWGVIVLNINETERICPLCGQDNNCQHDKECWCQKVTIPNYIIEMIPEDKKGKACVCKACLDRYKK